MVFMSKTTDPNRRRLLVVLGAGAATVAGAPVAASLLGPVRTPTVREGDEFGAAEGARSALDRMDSPEGGVDVLRIAGALVQRLELLLQGTEELLAFLEEGLLEFCQRIHSAGLQFW